MADDQLIQFSGTYTDQYELTMAEVYFLSGRFQDRAVFDYFFRKMPFNSGYAIFAGLQDLLHILQEFRFTQQDLHFLEQQKFNPAFINYLSHFSFKGDIYSCDEGEIIFPNEPILRVEGSLLEAQIIETLLLNLINFQTLIATKANRIRSVAPLQTLVEFGLRRAQGPGGYYAARASIIGGFDGTSHLKAACDYGLKTSGTMAHSFVQSQSSELEAFRKFAELRPHDCIFLLDTYSTLRSGLPHAIQVAKEMENKGHKLRGVRLDSGDLAYLSKECRTALDRANLGYVKILVSNQLDEYVIRSLLDQNAPIDIFGVGTSLVIGRPDGALDGVYKLSEVNGIPKIKQSESVTKVNLPHKKQIYRALTPEGQFVGADVIGMRDEHDLKKMYHPIEDYSSLDVSPYTKEPLLKLQMEHGRQILPVLAPYEIRQFSLARLAQLPMEYKRFTNPHRYKVGLSQRLKLARDQLLRQYREKT